ncbi:hypothetical protein P3T76_014768 [Phytophthora citrophthora]|uniref:HAT C-terminal dimerisation domain-containing protein n=1 Tax=Phytophthora citrophthora TaxID=4793 RepID=A0AAD9G0P2_9STRA|nr:hypothetical protein P3T76_014768 [Phytophthora citrophthora]
MENMMLNMQGDGWNLGVVLTDGAGQCAKARRTLRLRWPKNCFLTCFAHAANNLAKAVLKSEYSTVTKQASRAVTVLNNSASKWLEEAKACMVQKYGYSLNLNQLCETRWNSMQGCFASLLRVRGSLQNIAFTFRDANLPDDLRIFGSQSFWETLIEAEQVIRPLAYASLKLQRDENTLADVVICYLDIFTSFSSCEHGRRGLTRLVEKHWHACEQPLMLLAVFLHPLATGTQSKPLDKTPMTKRTSLCRIAANYYRRLIGEDTTNLYTDLMAWLNGSLDTPEFTSVGTIHAFWFFAQADLGNSKVPELAIVILAMVANTATCERYFSELALIHTSKRNRLSVD